MVASIVVACASWVDAAQPPVTIGPPIVVTAPRIDAPVSDVLIGARVITAQDIERSRAATLPQLLQSSPDIRTRELPGSPNPNIDLRSFGSFGDQNTLVLVDGVRMREYEQLSVNWSSIPLSSVERIEILPANSSVLYGGGATGGAINIITKAAQSHTRSGYVGAGAASHDTREARAGAAVAGESAGLRVHGSHYETDNYRDNSRVRIDSANADVRWMEGASALTLKFGADDQRLGLPGVISEAQIAVNRRQSATLRDFATQTGAYLNLMPQLSMGSADLSAPLSYRKRDTASHFRMDTPLRNSVETQVRVWSLAPRLRFKPQLGGWNNNVIVGADFEDWKFDADSGPTIAGRPHSTQRSAALYAQHTMRFATQTTAALGAREQHVHYNVVDRAKPGANGERRHTLHAWDVSVRQALAPVVYGYAKVGSSFRLPNVNDNYNPFFASVTLLEPQTARDKEVGLEASSGAVRYRSAFYRAELDNEIFFDPMTLGSRNRQPTRRQALTLEARWQTGPSLDMYASYAYADATFRQGSVGGVSLAGKRVPLTPRHLLDAGIAWSFTSSAHASFDVRHVGRSVFDADETNRFGREIPAYTVADLKLNVRSGGWIFNGGARNLFGEKYFSYGVYTGSTTYLALPAQERMVFVSAQYDFK